MLAVVDFNGGQFPAGLPKQTVDLNMLTLGCRTQPPRQRGFTATAVADDDSSQCASSQLSAARASTCSGTESRTAGNGASCMVCCTTGKVAATSSSGTSKLSSSCTCNSICAESF